MKEVIILFLSISIFTSIDMVTQSKKELRKKKKRNIPRNYKGTRKRQIHFWRKLGIIQEW